ncbi:hypothetical protein BDV93DRAFT_371594 [Ceratobasidium sp. AG-I]|nr:hypothetical protein BDV93DRAFT_371594 [Ceratobasidium sp. AG-I]
MSALGVLEAPPPPPPALPHQSSSPRSNRYDPILSSTPVREYPSSSSRAVYDKEPPLSHLPAPTAAREFSSPSSFDFHRAESSVRGRSESRGGGARRYTESARDDERYRRVEDEARRPPPIDLATYRERERLSVSSDRERPPVTTEQERLSISVDRERERLPLPTPTERSQDPLSHPLLTPRIAPPGDAYLFPQPAVSPFGPPGALGLSDVGKMRVSSRGREVDSRTREERREGSWKGDFHSWREAFRNRREVSRHRSEGPQNERNEALLHKTEDSPRTLTGDSLLNPNAASALSLHLDFSAPHPPRTTNPEDLRDWEGAEEEGQWHGKMLGRGSGTLLARRSGRGRKRRGGEQNPSRSRS